MPTYLGIDWSKDKPALCFVNPAGAAVARTTIPHPPAGFLQLDELRQQVGVGPAACWVALETAHNLLIDFLWAHEDQQEHLP